MTLSINGHLPFLSSDHFNSAHPASIPSIPHVQYIRLLHYISNCRLVKVTRRVTDQ